MKSLLIAAFAAFVSLTPLSGSAEPSRTACFTPGQDCTGLIAAAIDDAKSDLRVQSYYLTSYPIIDAIKRAKARGINIQIIVDRAMVQQRNSPVLEDLAALGIEIFVDDTVKIAHNKVVVIDGHTV